MDQAEREIVLDGFSDSNYATLNQSIETSVCIRGVVWVSSMGGLHFPLKPGEEDGVITLGYSRILTSLGYDYALRHRIVDGRKYRICGTLRDATPFPKCDRDDCRWYELVDSTMR